MEFDRVCFVQDLTPFLRVMERSSLLEESDSELLEGIFPGFFEGLLWIPWSNLLLYSYWCCRVVPLLFCFEYSFEFTKPLYHFKYIYAISAFSLGNPQKYIYVLLDQVLNIQSHDYAWIPHFQKNFRECLLLTESLENNHWKPVMIF